jgi:DNA-binding CsgD family transcriptional regulator
MLAFSFLLAVIQAIIKQPGSSKLQTSAGTTLDQLSVNHALATLEADYLMKFDVKGSGYQIIDWGLLSPQRVQHHCLNNTIVAGTDFSSLHIIDDTLLSERELQCVSLWLSGKTSIPIADLLGISHRTVESHLQSAKLKLHVRTRHELLDKICALELLQELKNYARYLVQHYAEQ